MWNVNPVIMCRKHLLGEHLECHMFAGTLLAGKNITGYIQNGLVEIHNIQSRHDELANEMITRGYNHKSPLQSFPIRTAGHIDSEKNLIELRKRCTDCARNIT